MFFLRPEVLYSIIAITSGFCLFVFLREILFFGFAPFFPSRPEAIKMILNEIQPREKMFFYSLSYGRSGFLYEAEKRFPDARVCGTEKTFLSFWLSRIQLFLRRSRIKASRKNYYKTDLRRSDVVYCHLDPKELREMYRKLKLEPKSGALVISDGFVVPYLEPLKVMPLPESKRWFSFLIRHRRVLTSKEREHKRDNNVYFYEV
jgi:hypothetical protein